MTGQAGIRTHILTTPEPESDALHRSATTLQLNEIAATKITFLHFENKIDTGIYVWEV